MKCVVSRVPRVSAVGRICGIWARIRSGSSRGLRLLVQPTGLRHPGVKHGLGDALNTVAAQHIISQTYPPVTGAIAKLLVAGAADGSFRSALDPADVLILMGFLWRVPTRPRVGRWPLGCSTSCWRAFVRSGC